MKGKTLPTKTLILWEIRVVMLTALLVFCCVYYSKVMPFLLSVAFIIAVLGLALVVFYLPKFFATYEIELVGEAIIINYGVFIKSSHIMPYSRLIYAQSFTSPLARMLGVSALSLQAARSRVIIPEIETKEALKVINSLTNEVFYEKD